MRRAEVAARAGADLSAVNKIPLHGELLCKFSSRYTCPPLVRATRRESKSCCLEEDQDSPLRAGSKSSSKHEILSFSVRGVVCQLRKESESCSSDHRRERQKGGIRSARNGVVAV